MQTPMTSFAALVADSTMLAVEAQQVVGLRMLKMASFDSDAGPEAFRMVEEKFAALAEASWGATIDFMTGAAFAAPGRSVARVRRTVHANRNRLLRNA
ncbi:MAG: hypothetical protein AAFR04_01750 [Pseudomonadota bacterium]